MRHYYIYYRIAPAQAAAIAAAVQGIQQQLESKLGICGRLLKKHDEPDLWMEIYEGVAESVEFEAALHAAEMQSGITGLLSTGETRHIECFED